MCIDKDERLQDERIKFPASPLEGKAGCDAPGERETRRKEYLERVYQKEPENN